MDKNSRNILIAFLLNLFFSIFELIGGLFTNSVAILSDAVHDLGDAISIGLSFVLEKKSKKKADNNYTYGYTRYSLLGAFTTLMILFMGSIVVICNSVNRLFNPVEINHNGMIVLAIIGTVINVIASLVTKDGNSINQKAVNLHMLEDAVGWIIVLLGAVLMKFTEFNIIDSLLSIGLSLFILINVIKNFAEIKNIFLEKVPNNINIDEIKRKIKEIENIKDIFHIHIWKIDEENISCTMHVLIDEGTDECVVKHNIRHILEHDGINHATIEIHKGHYHEKDLKCNLNEHHHEHKCACHHHNH